MGGVAAKLSGRFVTPAAPESGSGTEGDWSFKRNLTDLVARHAAMDIALAFAIQISVVAGYLAVCAGLWLFADWTFDHRLPPPV
jgi:hypothetical protein